MRSSIYCLCQFLTANPAAQPINRGFLLLLALLVLLGAFFIGVLLLNLARRNRRKAEDARRLAERAARPKDALDPWYEAGRRAKADDEDS